MKFQIGDRATSCGFGYPVVYAFEYDGKEWIVLGDGAPSVHPAREWEVARPSFEVGKKYRLISENYATICTVVHILRNGAAMATYRDNSLSTVLNDRRKFEEVV